MFPHSRATRVCHVIHVSQSEAGHLLSKGLLYCVFYILLLLGHSLPGQQQSRNTIHSLDFFFFLSDLPWWLILIRQKALVGKLPGDHEVCKVTKIAVLSLSEMEPQELELEVRWRQGTVTETPRRDSRYEDLVRSGSVDSGCMCLELHI